MRTSGAKVQERRCAVCSSPLTWPSVEFCSAKCGETWIRQAREKESVLTAPKGKP